MQGYVGADARNFDCPSTSAAPDDGFSAARSGKALGDLDRPATIPVTADLRPSARNPTYAITDWRTPLDPRHARPTCAVVGYADGQVGIRRQADGQWQVEGPR